MKFYEVIKDGTSKRLSSKPLTGIVRAYPADDRKHKKPYVWAQIRRGKIVAAFRSDEIVMMLSKV